MTCTHPASPSPHPASPRSPRSQRRQGKASHAGGTPRLGVRVLGDTGDPWPETEPWNGLQGEGIAPACGGVRGAPGPPARCPDRLSSATPRQPEVRCAPAQLGSLSATRGGLGSSRMPGLDGGSHFQGAAGLALGVGWRGVCCFHAECRASPENRLGAREGELHDPGHFCWQFPRRGQLWGLSLASLP